MALTRRSGAFLVLACGVFFSFGGLFFRATEGVDAWQYLTLRGAGGCDELLQPTPQPLGSVLPLEAARPCSAGLVLGSGLGGGHLAD